MARPKKTAGQAKTYMLRIRMTEEQRKAMDRAAESKGLEVSTWARSELLLLAKRIAAKE
jgi:uncharacterized protein (DUF1778 family)